jgi:hypothetical protein
MNKKKTINYKTGNNRRDREIEGEEEAEAEAEAEAEESCSRATQESNQKKERND